MLLAIDFDDVICDSKNVPPGHRMGPPMPGARDGINELRSRGHKVVVHSVRGDHQGHVSKWLKYFDITVDGITNVKPNADVFLDDKAVRFVDWPSVLTAVRAEV